MPANEVTEVGTNDLQPGVDEVVQLDDVGPEPAIRVSVDGIDAPVRTQELPRKAGATRTRTITTTPVRVLTPDHRRASATFVMIGQNLLFAFSAAAAGDPSAMALWPEGIPYMLTADTELWVATQTGSATLSVATEMWAVGK